MSATEKYVGLAVTDAQKLAEENQMRFRVVRTDGESNVSTTDIRRDRISASVKDGCVVSAEIK